MGSARPRRGHRPQTPARSRRPAGAWRAARRRGAGGPRSGAAPATGFAPGARRSSASRSRRVPADRPAPKAPDSAARSGRARRNGRGRQVCPGVRCEGSDRNTGRRRGSRCIRDRPRVQAESSTPGFPVTTEALRSAASESFPPSLTIVGTCRPKGDYRDMDRGMGPAVLVTGGAGYIGAHTAKALHEQGFTPVVFDSLTSGFRDAVQWGPFVEGDIRDRAALTRAMEAHDVQAVIHFAGLIEVGRSTARPDLFWEVNVSGTVDLLSVMRERGVGRLVFSSSAAVYGQGGRGPLETIAEDAAKAPASPYGDTKLAAEWMIAAQCRAYGLTAVALRYFNAAGADPAGLIGEAHEPETHLIPLAIAAALGDGKPLTVFGQDFDTPDGTC